MDSRLKSPAHLVRELASTDVQCTPQGIAVAAAGVDTLERPPAAASEKRGQGFIGWILGGTEAGQERG